MGGHQVSCIASSWWRVAANICCSRGRAESGVGIDTVDSEDNNNMFINWLKLQTVALEDDRADQDDAEASGSGAKTKPAVQPKPSSGGTLKKTAGRTKPSSMSAAPATRSAPSSLSRPKTGSSKGKAVGAAAEPGE